MPTILKPPRDQWASPEVTDTSHLCSDPTSANVCQMSANMSRRPWPSLLLEVCARSGLAAIEVAGEPVRAAGAAGGAAGVVSRTVSVAPTIKIILFADGTNNWPSSRVFPG
jgi:hypothetical protein